MYLYTHPWSKHKKSKDISERLQRFPRGIPHSPHTTLRPQLSHIYFCQSSKHMFHHHLSFLLNIKRININSQYNIYVRWEPHGEKIFSIPNFKWHGWLMYIIPSQNTSNQSAVMKNFKDCPWGTNSHMRYSQGQTSDALTVYETKKNMFLHHSPYLVNVKRKNINVLHTPSGATKDTQGQRTSRETNFKLQAYHVY